jgi:putative toxin-antitoxin system toxin component, PIN family
MINVVLDTNVLVSGLLSANGIPTQIVNAFKDKCFILFYSYEILAEYSDVLFRERLGLNHEDVNNLLEEISKIGILITPDISNIPMSDEDDRVFYDVAKCCNAYLVTGNTKHYPYEPHILTPAQFIEMFEKRTYT